MLRDSLRRLLTDLWPTERAVENAADPKAIASIWQALVRQGLAILGSEPSEGGLREIVIVQDELGRAACPAPMLGAVLANLVLRAEQEASKEAVALRGALHAGNATACFVFGAFDGDPNAGALTVTDSLLDGHTALVEGAVGATHFLTLAEPGPVLAIVPREAAGIRLSETPGLAVPPLAVVRFDRVPTTAIPISREVAENLGRIASLALAARALGAASRGFELVLAHAKERQQFGQPIGRFQALQHKLANSLIALDASRLLLDNAARAHDAGSADWHICAAAARAYAGSALRQVSLETQHGFGAIGLSEEHEAPRHFRRVHADLIRHGGVRRAREELACALIEGGATLPDYDLGAAGNAFREEVRTWLKDNKPSTKDGGEHGHEEWGYDSDFTRLLGLKGWNHLSWPREHGGPGRTPLEQLAFMDEIQRADAPMGGRGDIQAHALMAFGSAEQKAEFLPRLARGEVTFCLGYSEPGAGSDLASLRTSAVRDGDDWVINGQKCWTTAAEKADFIWLAARTDESVRAHAGISLFIVPMKSQGLTVRPSMALYGHTFCEEFFDNVRVPASAIVGEPGQGWEILSSALATERMIMGSFIAQARTAFERLASCVRDAKAVEASLRTDGAVRDRIGALAAEVEAGRQLFMHCTAMAEQGSTPIYQAAMSKTYTGELLERLAESALDLLGGAASLTQGADGAVAKGRFEQLLRFSPVAVIGGGTNEIQRNLIAQRGLGLPR